MSDIFRDFDKKNEFPKVKIPKFATGGICNDAIFQNFSQIDEIVKDIQEKKDNAMAMEFTKNIGDLLLKNDVKVKITEYTKEIDENNSIEATYESRYGISIDELDFSEHDKVFEDKIAELERTINHELGNWDKLGITYQEILDMKAENEKLTQRIAELESMEMENVNEMPDSITIDGYKCKIIKTESGLYISRDEIYSIIDKEKEPLKQKCKELEDKHQSDCIEINRLNTAIDVLIHKVEYLRQFAGLE